MRRWYVSPIVQVVTALALLLPGSVPAAQFTCAGGDVACLIGAITTANTNGQTNTITLAAGTYTLTAVNNITVDGANGLPSITSQLTITGEKTAPTVIERSVVAPDFRLFHIAEGGTLVLDGLTLKDGSGAIANNGIVTLANSLLAGNIHGLGAGIGNNNTIAIVNTTLSKGDGISNDGTVTFTNSTLSGSGDLSNDGSIALTNSAINGSTNISNDGEIAFVNSTLSTSGDLSNDGTISSLHSTLSIGGNISNDGRVTMQNTIIVLGIAADCSGALMSLGHNLISLGHNLISNPPSCRINMLASDRIGAAGLGPFSDDGTPGHGHFPLLPGSPAIDAGNTAVCLPNDQLGHPRVGTCDMGAIEFPSALLTLSVNHSEFSSGDTLTLTGIFLPSPTPLQGDVYISLQGPGGDVSYLQQDGSMATAVQPFVSNATLVPQVLELFRYTLNGTEPAGVYRWFGRVTAPGTSTVIGEIAQAPFEVLVLP